MSAEIWGAVGIFQIMEAANEVDEFLQRHFSKKSQIVTWPDAIRPDIYGAIGSDGTLNSSNASDLCIKLGATAYAIIDELRQIIGNAYLYDPLRKLIDATATSLPLDRTGVPFALASITSSPRTSGAKRVIVGPKHAPYDKAFMPTFSLLNDVEPSFSNSDVEKIASLWCLSLHESVAAQLCALSMLEFDYLPFAFYRDMGKQTYDEMRHSLFFLETATALLYIIEEQAPLSSQLRIAVSNFRATKQGLPVPLEGNLFEVFWNADLAERFVLMHLDTETPGVSALRHRGRSSLWDEHPELRDGFELVALDEETHARLGRRWINHLLPDVVKRNHKIEEARFMRGVLLATAFAHNHNRTASDIMVSIIDQHASQKAAVEQRAT